MRFAYTILAAAALGAAEPAAAEVVETSSQGFVTQDMAEVAASPMETWLALIRPGEWWNDAHTWSADAANMTLTPQAGGCFCERVPGEDRSKSRHRNRWSTHKSDAVRRNRPASAGDSSPAC